MKSLLSTSCPWAQSWWSHTCHPDPWTCSFPTAQFLFVPSWVIFLPYEYHKTVSMMLRCAHLYSSQLGVSSGYHSHSLLHLNVNLLWMSSKCLYCVWSRSCIEMVFLEVDTASAFLHPLSDMDLQCVRFINNDPLSLFFYPVLFVSSMNWVDNFF